MTRKIKWSKKELNSGKDSSGVSNIQGINGTEKGVKQGYTHGSLTKGLVAYYPMERGKGQIIRDAALNNTGQIKGAGWTNNSQVGDWVLEFDGDDDYVDTGFNLNKQLNADQTIALWIYPLDQESAIISGNDNETKRWDLRYGWEDTDDIYYVQHETSHRVTTSETAPEEEWTHVVLVYQEYEGDLLAFVNGSKDSILIEGEALGFDSDTNLILAAEQDEPPTRRWFNGRIDDVRVYNRALSQPEIQALYNLSRPNGVEVAESDVPSQSSGGVSRWRFDDDSDTDTATDSWGGNHGVISGAEYTSQRVYGSSALSFDGEGDNVNPNDIVTDDILNSGNEDVLTYSAWIKSDSTSSWSVFVGTRRNYNFQITTDDTYSYILAYDDERNNIHVEGNTEIIDGNWHHIVGIWDQGHIKLYVDGKLDATKKVPAPMSTNDDRIGIGGDIDNDTRYFSGKIDDVRIYNKALTPVQVEKLFKKGSYRISRGDTLQ